MFPKKVAIKVKKRFIRKEKALHILDWIVSLTSAGALDCSCKWFV